METSDLTKKYYVCDKPLTYAPQMIKNRGKENFGGDSSTYYRLTAAIALGVTGSAFMVRNGYPNGDALRMIMEKR